MSSGQSSNIFNNTSVRSVQAGRGSGQNDTGIGPIYSTPLFLQRGHGIGNYYGSLFPWVKPIFWNGAKALGRETLLTGGKILSDITEKRSPEASAGDIVTRHVTESIQNLISKLRERGRKRARGPASKNKRKTNKRAKITKRVIFS